ncbi:MAG: hypothetical protein UY52_C0047G0002 [Parcubacteria group bacterium GW2011_GWC2_49_9]|nr:MAG: hypothetical protein UY52_C0047G0002 [Parcubacteria group bacterium GW2011_GWC2_49_9]
MNPEKLMLLFTEELERHTKELDAWAHKNKMIRPDQKIALRARTVKKKRALVPQRDLTQKEWGEALKMHWTGYQEYVIRVFRRAAKAGRALEYDDVWVPKTVRGKFIMCGGRFGSVNPITYQKINQRFSDTGLPFAIVEYEEAGNMLIKLAVCTSSLL